jgi:hypothetical protein
LKACVCEFERLDSSNPNTHGSPDGAQERLQTGTTDKPGGSSVNPVRRHVGANQPPHLDGTSAAFAGAAGAFVETFEAHTEADPAALLFSFCAVFGGMVGDTAEILADGALHIPTLYVAQVGRSSRARKDTTHRRVEQVANRIEDRWFTDHNVGSFGSGEAMIESASERPGSTLLLMESELSRLFVVASRDGSTASQVMRQGWDYRPLKYRTMRKATDAPATPVVMLGNITLDELTDNRAGLRANDIHNGFGNRISWVFADRRQRLPVSSDPAEADLNDLVRMLRANLVQARRAGRMTRTPGAEALWHELYDRMADDDPPGASGHLTSRAEAQVLRFSMIQALVNGSAVIDRPHLESAWEMWRYVRWSVQHIWSPRDITGDPDLDRIAAYLDAGHEIDGRELDRMFDRRTQAVRAKALESGIAVERDIQRHEVGRPAKVLCRPDQPEQRNKPGWWTSVDFKRGDV